MAKDDHTIKRVTEPAAPSGAIELLRDALSHVYDSSIVYGDPVIFADRAVIPAARVSSGGGGGYGLTPAEDGGDGHVEEGAGMGHGVHARPVGYIEVTAEGSRWVPAIDVGAIVMAVTVAVVLVAFAWFFRRRPRRRR
jgi:uncharacterized spore protein YtfJ